MVAWIGRGMEAAHQAKLGEDFVITQRDITVCRLEPRVKMMKDQCA
jgi:hypothetical protein